LAGLDAATEISYLQAMNGNLARSYIRLNELEQRFFRHLHVASADGSITRGQRAARMIDVAIAGQETVRRQLGLTIAPLH